MLHKLLIILLIVPLSLNALGETRIDSVVVEKSKRRLLLLKDDKVYRQYPIALGSQPAGHKQQQGDGRTPEGRYTIDSRNSGSAFYRSLHISYPNSLDRENARQRGVDPGGAIFLHGQPKRMHTGNEEYIRRDWTLGCIAVSNSAMDEIWQLVRDGTPIDIRP